MQKTRKNNTRKNMDKRNKSKNKKVNKGKNTKKKLNEWQLLVKKTVKENPKLTFGECLKLASKNRKKK